MCSQNFNLLDIVHNQLISFNPLSFHVMAAFEKMDYFSENITHNLHHLFNDADSFTTVYASVL